MTSSLDVDFAVIGGGSGGVRAARVAAQLGARVALCEAKDLGGTCVNVGCVPKKLLVLGAHFSEEVRDAAGYGWTVAPPTHDWARLVENKDREIRRLNGVYERVLRDAGVTILRGRGVLEAPGRVRVSGPDGETELRARHVLLAVGGRPSRPTFEGAELALVSDDVFHLRERPRRLLILGGGYIAVEFAGVFAGFGSRVTQLYRGSLFLRGFDDAVRTHLDREMRKGGIDLRFRRDVARLERLPAGDLRATLDDGSTLEVDAVLAAIGRVPNTAGLGLEAVGVETEPGGAIRVDERFRTSVPGVHAVGDAIDRVQLTPVALAEGSIVARNLFGGADLRADYDLVPSAVFSSPPIGTVGLTEGEARATFGAIDVYQSTFTPMKATLGGGEHKTLMKLVVDAATQRVVGLHMVGPDAGEIVQGFAVALRCGATKAQFDATLGIHPTAAEEFVTMRTKLPDPDHDLAARHEERPKLRRVVHHRWGSS